MVRFIYYSKVIIYMPYIADDRLYINPIIIPTSVLLSDKSQHLNLSPFLKRDLQEYAHKMSKLQIEDPTVVWGGSSLSESNLIILNDSLRYFNDNLEKDMFASEIHERTHLILSNKVSSVIRSCNNEFEEGVAWARESFVYSNSNPNSEKVHSMYKPSYKNNNHEKMVDSFHTYISVAEELGDDIALNLARESKRYPNALKKFKEAVSDYKLNLQRIFG